MNSDFKLFPQKYFDDIKTDPDNNYFSPVIDDLVKYLNKKNRRIDRILDVGCGNGLFSKRLKDDLSAEIVGIDGSEFALKEAALNGFNKCLKINDFSADALPLDDRQFDLVICKDVLEHLLCPDVLVAEIGRVLKIDGIVLCHVPNHFPLTGRVRLLLTGKIDTFQYFPGAKDWNHPHIRFFTSSGMAELFQISGMECVMSLSYHFIRLSFFNRIVPLVVQRALVNRFPNALSSGVTLVFKKIK